MLSLLAAGFKDSTGEPGHHIPNFEVDFNFTIDTFWVIPGAFGGQDLGFEVIVTSYRK